MSAALFTRGWSADSGSSLFQQGWFVAVSVTPILRGGYRGRESEKYLQIVRRLVREDEELMAIIISLVSSGELD